MPPAGVLHSHQRVLRSRDALLRLGRERAPRACRGSGDYIAAALAMARWLRGDMPVKQVVTQDLSLVVGRAWGVLTADELLVMPAVTRAHPDFRPHFRQLADFRDVAEFDFSGEDVRRMAGQIIYAPNARRVFIAGSDVSFGLGRMYQLLREVPDDGLCIVRDLAEALAWLDLTDHAAQVLQILDDLVANP